MNTNLMNEVDHLYDQLVETNTKGNFLCPVCGKDYATRAGIYNHMKQKDCVPANVLFENTMTERVGHEFFQRTVGDFSRSQRTNLSAFRKCKHYKGVLKFTLNCMNQKISPDMLYEFVRLKKKPRYYNQFYSYAVKDSIVNDFRVHLIKNEELIESESFYERNKNKLDSDDVYLSKSIQKGDIGLDFCVNSGILSDERIKDLDQGSRVRLLSVVKVKEE